MHLLQSLELLQEVPGVRCIQSSAFHVSDQLDLPAKDHSAEPDVAFSDREVVFKHATVHSGKPQLFFCKGADAGGFAHDADQSNL